MSLVEERQSWFDRFLFGAVAQNPEAGTLRANSRCEYPDECPCLEGVDVDHTSILMMSFGQTVFLKILKITTDRERSNAPGRAES
jgi:hypothetical protein